MAGMTSTKREAALKDYLSLVAGLPRVSPLERAALAQRLQAGGDAQDAVALMESYLPLVVAEAALHRGLGARFQALIAAGNRALAQCLRRSPAAAEAEVRDAVRAALRLCAAHAAVRKGA